LHELAWAGGVGLSVNAEVIPVFPETQALCNHFHLDPLGLIASGALLIVAPKNRAEEILKTLDARNIAATTIGEITDRRNGIKMITAEGSRDLPLYEQDEITRI
jgi:hydrogenase maturation factor